MGTVNINCIYYYCLGGKCSHPNNFIKIFFFRFKRNCPKVEDMYAECKLQEKNKKPPRFF